MRKIVLISLVSLVVISLSGTSLQISRSGGNVLNIGFQLPTFRSETIEENGLSLNKLKVNTAEDESWQENMSGLPQIDSWIYLPDGFDAQITLTNPVTEEIQNFSCSKTDDPADIDTWLDISEPMIFRGNRILSFCVKPFRYNNANQTLTTLQSADISVQFIPGQSTVTNERYQSPVTQNMLKSLCINRDDIRTINGKPGSYIILYNGASLLTQLQPLVDWKREKGYDVRLINTTTIGNSTTAIKSYIQTAYDTWDNPPEFILICGRGTYGNFYVPTYVENYHYNTVGDYKYTLLEGTDLIPDAYIGRMTFATEDEIQTEVNRLISYEKMVGLSPTNWLNKSFLLADTSDSGISCLTTVSYIKNLIMDYNLSTLFIEAYSGSFPSQINAALDSGVGTYWYRGHGDFSGWTTTNINNLNNIGKYFFFSYITCFTANFGNSTVSQAERLIRLGTPTLPRGAIGVIGSSCETHTCLNNITTGGIAYGIYSEGLTQGGPAMVRGKLSLIANYPQNPANYLNQYMQCINLLGDPGLDIWLKQVDEILVTTPSELYSGGANASFRVTLTNNEPVEGAWVCISDASNEIQTSGFTDSNGWLVISYGSTTSATAKVTITKPNHRTYQASVPVINNSPQLTMQNIPALQQCYAGSELTFPISVINNGSSALTNVSGTLVVLSDGVSITQANADFGNIASGLSVQSQSDYEIAINTDAPKGEILSFNLHLNYDEGSFDLPFYCHENGPNINLNEANFSNNLLNHGTNTLNMNLQNITSVSLAGLQAHLESTHPLLTIQNPSQNLGAITPNETFSFPDAYVLVVADSLLEGVNVRFNLSLYNSSGFSQVIRFDKRIGSPSTNDVTGPDEYGYICYGQGDSEYVSYNWIELEPTLGGSGTNLNLYDTSTDGSGDYATINMPFQLRYYGRTYSQITICSNGFIMPGPQGSIEWMNWEIPGPMVPRPIIAPFWDDLMTDTSGRVLYQYDNTINAMIIQWQNLKNKYSQSMRETFQVVLYDPLYHASPSGDSPILFQYKTFNNVDGGNYGVDYIDHGQYATVGIGDHTGHDGIGYTFNNQYPATAQTISNFSTLYFTTLPNYMIDSELIILNASIDEINGNDNGLADAGEQLGLSFMVKNIGMGAFAEGQATLLTEDPYITILQGQAILPELLSNQIETTNPVFVVDISSTCPNQHAVNFILHIENGSDAYDLPFELNVNAFEFVCHDVMFIDSNNNFPEPGENGQIQFTLENLSHIDAINLSVTLDSPANVIVIPESQTVNILSMSSQQLTFNVSFDETTEQGSLVDFNLDLTISDNYTTEIPMPVLIGIPDVFLETGFEETDLSTIIQTAYNITVQPSQYINDEGNELLFLHSFVNPWSYAFLYPANTIDLIAARVSFTWFTANTEASLSLMALLPDQTELTTLWSSNQPTTSPRTEYIYLDDFPENIDNIVFVLVTNMFGADDSPVALDDLSIFTIHHAPGFIAGNVSLDMYPELVTQVRVKVRYSNEAVYPDAEGNYMLPAYQGVNVVTADLEGFVSSVDTLAVSVVSGQTTTGQDFIMQRLCAPLDLNYSIDGNVLTLNWDLEGQERGARYAGTDKNDRFLAPEYYRIWIRWNNLNLQDTSLTQTYSRMIQLSGDYEIYVCSVYLFGGMEEIYSSPSNLLNFTITSDGDDIAAPLVFALDQNHPNPFNPSTHISFTLPEANKVDLTIYNLKGQQVRNLVSANLDNGSHSVIWNGLDNKGMPASSGIYYYKLHWQGKELVRKMVMLK